VKIEIVVADDRLESAVEAIQKAARTGRIGDAKSSCSMSGSNPHPHRRKPAPTPSKAAGRIPA